MIDFLRSLSDTGFAALVIALLSGLMIVLQAAVNRSVWTGYILVFFAALVTLLVTLR